MKAVRHGCSRSLVALVAAWALVVCSGMGLLLRYSLNPGTAAAAPERWPLHGQLERFAEVPTLVMVAHPRCSCTRASIGELSKLMTRLHGQVEAYVVFVKPPGSNEAWERTDLWRSASLIEGVTMVVDEGGVIAARFGAKTSGQVYLYAADGARLFAGGITPTRSHYGDNVGRQRIVSLVTEGASDRDVSAVYGCPVTEDEPIDSWVPNLALSKESQ